MGQDPDKAEGVNALCDSCKGTGKAHSPRDLKGASQEVRAAIDQQCKLTGLYVPDSWAALNTDEDVDELDFMDELAGVDPADLEADLMEHMAAAEAAGKEIATA
jgi:hypothetical protein